MLCRSRQQQQLARKRREYLDMVPEFYDIENSQRTEDEIGALRQVGNQGSWLLGGMACMPCWVSVKQCWGKAALPCRGCGQAVDARSYFCEGARSALAGAAGIKLRDAIQKPTNASHEPQSVPCAKPLSILVVCASCKGRARTTPVFLRQ